MSRKMEFSFYCHGPESDCELVHEALMLILTPLGYLSDREGLYNKSIAYNLSPFDCEQEFLNALAPIVALYPNLSIHVTRSCDQIYFN